MSKRSSQQPEGKPEGPPQKRTPPELSLDQLTINEPSSPCYTPSTPLDPPFSPPVGFDLESPAPCPSTSTSTSDHTPTTTDISTQTLLQEVLSSPTFDPPTSNPPPTIDWKHAVLTIDGVDHPLTPDPPSPFYDQELGWGYLE